MNEWVFTITDYDAAGSPTVTVVDNPKNWNTAKIKIKRDPNTHGIMTDYSFNNLKFSGVGRDILEAAYAALGIEANTTIAITWDCDNQQLLYNGKFNYGKYKKVEDYNGGCWVECPIEQVGATMCMLNRWDQKVNLDTLEDFAGNVLAPYAGLGFDLILEPKRLLQTGSVIENNNQSISIRGVFPEWNNFFNNAPPVTVQGWFNVPFDEIYLNETPTLTPDNQLQPNNTKFIFTDGANFGLGGPQNNFIFNNETYPSEIGTYDVDIRLKGEVSFNGAGGLSFCHLNSGLFLVIKTISGLSNPNTSPGTTLAVQTILAAGAANGIHSFDLSYVASISMNLGQKIYCFMSWDVTSDTINPLNDIQIVYEDVTHFNLSGLSTFPATTSKSYLINEVLSREVEAITDSEMRVYSEYFGRTDAEPIPSAADGCGSLEVLTSGLLVRNALPGGQQPLFALSLKETYEALKAIHCIGLGIEPDIVDPTKNMVRIESFDYFYQSGTVFVCDKVNKFELNIFENGYISIFKFGYAEVFPAEQFNGIDDFLTNREYRSTLSNTKNTLEALSAFIASGYAIEVTRQQVGTTADYRYDNKTFIICVERDGPDYVVEQGNITNAANIVDPPTIYNYRLSPWRNALRWFRILFTDYITGSLADNFIFASGTGNYFAEGNLTGGCIVERTFAANSEMGNINYFSFQSYTGNIPLWKNERVKFDYPLTVSQFNQLQDIDPVTNAPYLYSLIGYNFANGTVLYGWIDEIEYTPAEGIASYLLIPERTE